MAMHATTAPRNVKHAHKKQQAKDSKDVQKSLEPSYTKFFAPQQSTPENFKIFTLIDWEIPVSTGNHT